MEALSQKILDAYQVRKTRKQKTAFIELLRGHYPQLQIQQGGFPRCRNIIIGDVEKAKVIYTAHYDTCARLPFPNFIAPKNALLSIGYSVLMALPIVAIIVLSGFLFALFPGLGFWGNYWLRMALLFVCLALMIAGPANKHTANDNTSGVITLCELMAAMPEDHRQKAAFVFFDLEEAGMIGSSHFRSKYKEEMKDKLLVNFDCVSDGDHILVAVSKKARKVWGDAFADSFLPEGEKHILLEKAEKVFYPSDQMGFRRTVAVASLKHKPRLGYYMNRIHTGKDTVFDERNIQLLTRAGIRLLEKL